MTGRLPHPLRSLLLAVTLAALWPGAASGTGAPVRLSVPGTVGFVDGAGATAYLTVSSTARSGVWASDGTRPGTRLLAPAAIPFTIADYVRVVGQRVFFVTDANGNGSGELWVTGLDGRGTERLAEIDPGCQCQTIEGLHALGDLLVFTALAPDTRREPWRSDGTTAGTTIVRNIHPELDYSQSSEPNSYFDLGGRLVFSADDGVHGQELWVTDGTEAGTVLLADIAQGDADAGSGPRDFTRIGDVVYFSAQTAAEGRELWRLDPGAEPSVSLVRDIRPGGDGTRQLGSSPTQLVALGDTLLFVATTSDTFPATFELWRSDGTAAGTSKVAGPWRGAYAPAGLTVAGDVAYFTAGDDRSGPELWRTNGTRQGTRLVRDIRPGPPSDDDADQLGPLALTAVGTALYFTADDGVHGREPWRTDGTRAGTQLLADIAPGDASSDVESIHRLTGALLLRADGGTALYGVSLGARDPARLRDRVDPVVRLAAVPASGARVALPLTLRGTARDASGIARVDVRVDVRADGVGPWLRASGTTSWSARIPASQRARIVAAGGRFAVAVRAVDRSGRISLLVTRSFRLRG